MAFAAAVVVKSARTRIHSRSQHKPRRESQRHGGPSDADRTVFERLPLSQPIPVLFRIVNVQISYPFTKISTPRPLSSKRLSFLCRKGSSTNAEKRSARPAADTDRKSTRLNSSHL